MRGRKSRGSRRIEERKGWEERGKMKLGKEDWKEERRGEEEKGEGRAGRGEEQKQRANEAKVH